MTELAEKIKALKNEGKSYREIQSILGCSKGTISYYLAEGQKEKTLNRTAKRRKNPNNALAIKAEKFRNRKNFNSKIRDFQRRDGSKLLAKQDNFFFTSEDLLEKIGNNPVCYLSGLPIDITKAKDYQLDHIIPASRGGSNNLDNLGITAKAINQMKQDLTVEEFLQNCKMILEYNGYIVSK